MNTNTIAFLLHQLHIFVLPVFKAFVSFYNIWNIAVVPSEKLRFINLNHQIMNRRIQKNIWILISE